MSDCCWNLLVEILSRLPVKSLMRFKCVSRSWYELINDSDFIKLHLQRSIQTNQTIIFFCSKFPYLYSAEFDTFEHLTMLGQPLKLINKVPFILGSCNGLLWLNYSPLCERRCFGFLYNPATQSFCKLPRLPDEEEYRVWFGFGLGYDSTHDDYKIVGIFAHLKTFVDDVSYTKLQSVVVIYSWKSNSWRRGQDLLYYQLSHKMQRAVYANGYLHWLAHENLGEYKKRIISVSLSDETYRELELPQCESNWYESYDLGALDGCLCLTVNYMIPMSSGQINSHCDIWIMRVYGVAGSWTKFLRIPEASIIYSPSREVYGNLRVIGFSKNKRQLFLEYDTFYLASYDLETKTIKKVEIGGLKECRDPIIYAESLVSIASSPTENLKDGEK